jgi:hypothetical protein
MCSFMYLCACMDLFLCENAFVYVCMNTYILMCMYMFVCVKLHRAINQSINKCDQGTKTADLSSMCAADSDPVHCSCIPACSGGCLNGDCTAPNKCTCHQGYSTKNPRSNICAPRCQQGCLHGDCTAPNVCTCHTGQSLLALLLNM